MQIPNKVMGLGGLIDVKVVEELELIEDKEADAAWDVNNRVIELVQRQPNTMQHRYYHELVHAAIDDSGIGNLLTSKLEEALCDLIATARMREEEV